MIVLYNQVDLLTTGRTTTAGSATTTGRTTAAGSATTTATMRFGMLCHFILVVIYSLKKKNKFNYNN